MLEYAEAKRETETEERSPFPGRAASANAGRIVRYQTGTRNATIGDGFAEPARFSSALSVTDTLEVGGKNFFASRNDSRDGTSLLPG